MKTQSEYELMEAAKVLADFARLQPEGVQDFRKDHPNFVPAVWWAESNWLGERDLLNKAWRAGFPAEMTLKLTTSRLFGMAHILKSVGFPEAIPNPSFVAEQINEVLNAAKGNAAAGGPSGNRILASDGADITKDVQRRVEDGPQVWPYQRAVLFLHIHPKQAKVCAECEKPFVSESPSAKRCLYIIQAEDSQDGLETNCVGVHRKKYKHDNWDDVRDRLNAERRAAYAAARKKNQWTEKTKRRR